MSLVGVGKKKKKKIKQEIKCGTYPSYPSSRTLHTFLLGYLLPASWPLLMVPCGLPCCLAFILFYQWLTVAGRWEKREIREFTSRHQSLVMLGHGHALPKVAALITQTYSHGYNSPSSHNFHLLLSPHVPLWNTSSHCVSSLKPTEAIAPSPFTKLFLNSFDFAICLLHRL